MPGRFDTPGKNAVRSTWNTPVLKYLNSRFGFKYRYLGLPGVELLDVKLWKNLIEEVIAFEAPASGADERANIKKLKTNLDRLGIPHEVYYGFLEQVVIYRMDLASKPYIPNRFVNLYNLDFCNELTSQIDDLGKRTCLRFDLIRRLLNDQEAVYRTNQKQNMFIILLTARNQTNPQIRDLLSGDITSKTRSFVEVAEKENPIIDGIMVGSHGWTLKAFVFDLLCNYFSTPNISYTPASISDRQPPQTEAIDEEPFDSMMSETMRTV